MEGFLAEKPNSSKLSSNSEQRIDLTLKLSPCGQNAEEKWLTRSQSTVSKGTQEEEGPFVPSLYRSCSLPAEAEKGLMMRFADLQTMRRVKTGKRLLLEKQRRAAAAAAAAAAETGKKLPNPSGDSRHEHEDNSPKQGNDSMVSAKTMAREMPQKPADTKLENPAKKLKVGNPCSLKGGDDAMDILRQMPSVTTTGDGPSGKRIEGFLYKYRGGQVCIVCVCHGSFLSPAEFVIHAGGKEVANPMKHITVCSNSF